MQLNVHAHLVSLIPDQTDQTFTEYSIPKLLTNTPINVCKVGCIGEFTGGHVIVKPGCHIN